MAENTHSANASSTLPKDDEKTDDNDDNDNDDAGQGGASGRSTKKPSSRKRKKKLTIHNTRSKSRINFLQLLRGAAQDYVVNTAALDYMRTEGLPKTPLTRIEQSPQTLFEDEQAWQDHLQRLGICKERHIRIATEGALLGTLIANGFSPELAIISDDAGQFNLLLHALCWIYANRVFQRILPLNEQHAKELDWVHTQIWDIYADLKQYKRQPTPALKETIAAHFDELCKTKTSYTTLNRALKRLVGNMAELLLVLQRPDIPLHNNLSEGDIHWRVKQAC